MAVDCPTGILLDFSESVELSPEPVLSTISLNSVPVCSIDFNDCANGSHFESPANKEENANVSNEFDCDFIENETLNDLSSCSTQSSSDTGDEIVPIIWSPELPKITSRKRAVKDDLSIGQRVEVFKEATCIAMHLENLIRGTPPPKPSRNFFTSPLLEKNLHDNIASELKDNLETRLKLDTSSKGIENKRPESEIENPISFRPPLSAKPEARVQPILKCKLKEKENTSEDLSMTLRVNRNKAMAATTSSSRPNGPMKAKKVSPIKKIISKDSLNVANRKTPLPNSKPVSKVYTPLNDRSIIDKRTATVARSSSFGAESMRFRRPFSVMSTSFSAFNPSINTPATDKQACPPPSSKANAKPVARRSVGAVFSMPVQPFASQSRRSFLEPCIAKCAVTPTQHLTPHKQSQLTTLKRSNSTSADIPKKNLLPVKRCSSTSVSSTKKTALPTPKLLAARLRSAILK